MLTELTHNDLVVLIVAWSIWTFLLAYLMGLSHKTDDGDSIFVVHFIGIVVYIWLGAILIWGGLYSLLAGG